MPVFAERIIGFSASPTRYKMAWSGREAYVRCGADLLLNGLRTDMRAQGKCPVCDGTITFQVTRGRLEELQPSESVPHVVDAIGTSGGIGIECDATHLFDKEDCLNRWMSAYNGRKGWVLQSGEYFEYLKDRLRDRLPA